jgi:ABC-2 type transport system permease protein
MKRGLSYHINLVKELVIADLKLKYRGSVLGYCWTVISPLLMFAVYYIVFSFIKMRASSFALYLLSGLLIWQFFSDGVRSGMNSVTNKSELITKMNFPKIVIPLTSVITSTVILTLNIIVFFIFYIIIKGTFSWTILLLPAICCHQPISDSRTCRMSFISP